MIIVNNSEIIYREGMTVEDALKEAGERTNFMDIIIVNGKVISRNDLSSTSLSDNSIVKLLPLVSGG